MICPQCNGYGSSLKEDAETCTKCGGSGVVCDSCGAAAPLDFKKHGEVFLCPSCSHGGPEPKTSIVMIDIPPGGTDVQ